MPLLLRNLARLRMNGRLDVMVHTTGSYDSSKIPVLRLARLPRPISAPRLAPRATLLNQAVMMGGVEITLLSYVVVERSMRLYGALRVMTEHEPILATVPVLELTPDAGGDPFHPVGASVLPQPQTVWLAWMFEIEQGDRGLMTAAIDRLELGFRTGRKTESVVGPWVFAGIPGIVIDHRPVPEPVAIAP